MFGSLKAMKIDQERMDSESLNGDKDKLVSSGFLNLLVSQTGWDIKLES